MKNLKATKMKHLQTMISKSRLNCTQLKEESRVLQSKLDKEKNLLKKYEAEMSQLTRLDDSLIVSEHAIVRYLQRIYKLDLEDIINEIASPQLFTQVKEFGNGVYSCEESFRAKVVDGVVVTILPLTNTTHNKGKK